VTEESADQQRK